MNLHFKKSPVIRFRGKIFVYSDRHESSNERKGRAKRRQKVIQSNHSAVRPYGGRQTICHRMHSAH